MPVQELLEETVQDDEETASAVKMFEAETLDELKKYLSSSIFHRVGPEMARRIVSTFGTRTVEIVEKTPNKLDEVRGVGKLRILSITKGWATQRRIKKACMMLTTPTFQNK